MSQPLDLEPIKSRIAPGGYSRTRQWEHRRDIEALIAEVEALRAAAASAPPASERPEGWLDGEIELTAFALAHPDCDVRAVLRGFAEWVRSGIAASPGAPSAPQEICICAAVKFADGRIARGHRHDACFITAAGWKPIPDRDGHVQGFMTSRNRFVDRAEGARLQNAAGIVSAQTGKPVVDELFSEDLYFDSHDHLAWAFNADGDAPSTPEPGGER